MLKVANNKLVIGKEEYQPFSAEMHYFRVNKRHWSICFERIRKAGFRIISTCVPWNLHESALGEYDFFGTTDHTKDLVVFLELAREFGFKVVLHPGPFVDSDWKNGGYPDFLYNYPEIFVKGPSGETFHLSNQRQIAGNESSAVSSLVESPSLLAFAERDSRGARKIRTIPGEKSNRIRERRGFFFTASPIFESCEKIFGRFIGYNKKLCLSQGSGHFDKTGQCPGTSLEG